MKNIHILPTDKYKSSRLVRNGKELLLVGIPKNYTFFGITVSVNIYITSDEEIKERDWILDIELNRIEQCLYSGTFRNWKKIILTTDQDLIKDGIQAIDDEFLEWFVKNPSCEEVEVREIEVEDYVGFAGHTSYPTFHKEYTIIIPKEQPKQETLEEVAERIVKSKVGLHYFGNENSLENLAKKEYVIEGAKWQQERSYSEEEVIDILVEFSAELKIISNITKWFKQFKKK